LLAIDATAAAEVFEGKHAAVHLQADGTNLSNCLNIIDLAFCSPATPSGRHAASLSGSRPAFSVPASGVQHAPHQQYFFSDQITPEAL
jgi:hypothetical protein